MYLSDKEGKIPFPKPREDDPGRYALLARFLNADSRLRWTLNYTVFMILGQSAGTAAALAIDEGIPVQDLDYAKLKAKLERAEQPLTWHEEPTKPAK